MTKNWCNQNTTVSPPLPWIPLSYGMGNTYYKENIILYYKEKIILLWLKPDSYKYVSIIRLWVNQMSNSFPKCGAKWAAFSPRSATLDPTKNHPDNQKVKIVHKLTSKQATHRTIWAATWENQQCGFWPGLTQTRLYSHWRWLEAWNFCI